MAVTGIDDIALGLAGKTSNPLAKTSPTTVAGGVFSLWNMTGFPGGQGVYPTGGGAGAVPTNATAGSFVWTNPTGGKKTYLGRAAANLTTSCGLVIADRLVHSGPHAFASGAIASVTATTPLTRQTTGRGVELWIEIATAMSALACTLTFSYTNEQGVAGRTGTCVVAASSTIHRMYPVTLQAGDQGVRSVESCSGSAAPTGNWNIVLMMQEALINVGAYVGNDYDWQRLGLPEIPDDAALFLMAIPSTTTLGIMMGSVDLIQV